MGKPKILYIEDMEKCHKLTKNSLGNSYEVVSEYTFQEGVKEVKSGIGNYDVLISDVNLFYDPSKSDFEQTKEGLKLIAIARNESIKRGIEKLPIFCISSDGSHRRLAFASGANIFLFKKEFWDGKGKKYLEMILAHNNARQKR